MKDTGNAKEEAAALHETPCGPGFKHFGNSCNIYDGGMIIYVATEFWYASIPLVLLIPPQQKRRSKGKMDKEINSRGLSEDSIFLIATFKCVQYSSKRSS